MGADESREHGEQNYYTRPMNTPGWLNKAQQAKTPAEEWPPIPKPNRPPKEGYRWRFWPPTYDGKWQEWPIHDEGRSDSGLSSNDFGLE